MTAEDIRADWAAKRIDIQAMQLADLERRLAFAEMLAAAPESGTEQYLEANGVEAKTAEAIARVIKRPDHKDQRRSLRNRLTRLKAKMVRP